MFTYSTTSHIATGYTSFARTSFWISTNVTLCTDKISKSYCYDDYAKKLKEQLQAINRIAREHIIKAKLTAKQQYNKNTKVISFKLGDKVLLHDETLRRGRSKKLDSL